jgi:protein SCO1/2
MKRRELITDFANKSRFIPHRASPGVRRFTNSLLRTHENKEVRFYDDLIRGRQVVINFMYADCHGSCPVVTATMGRIYDVHKDRMGKDLFFYSLTVQPEKDTPEALKAYAEMHRANRPGWTFLTGDPFDLETIRLRLFRMNHPGIDQDFASHAGTLRIINDATNCWAMAEAYASLRTVLQHLSWADPPKTLEQVLQANRELQAEVDREVRLYGYRKIV